ncbi:hypothetical protein [Cohnella phaseoli]|nr:hypothetical protein [Cohnella phaseoli]
MKYVIFLSTTSAFDRNRNQYGYWAGKTYRVEGQDFPLWDRSITEQTKKYTSQKRAETAAEKLMERCSYVVAWRIESVA